MWRDPSCWNLLLVPVQAIGLGALDVWCVRTIMRMVKR